MKSTNPTPNSFNYEGYCINSSIVYCIVMQAYPGRDAGGRVRALLGTSRSQRGPRWEERPAWATGQAPGTTGIRPWKHEAPCGHEEEQLLRQSCSPRSQRPRASGHPRTCRCWLLGVACSSQSASRPLTCQAIGPSVDLPGGSELGELAVSPQAAQAHWAPFRRAVRKGGLPRPPPAAVSCAMWTLWRRSSSALQKQVEGRRDSEEQALRRFQAHFQAFTALLVVSNLAGRADAVRSATSGSTSASRPRAQASPQVASPPTSSDAGLLPRLRPAALWVQKVPRRARMSVASRFSASLASGGLLKKVVMETLCEARLAGPEAAGDARAFGRTKTAHPFIRGQNAS